MPQVGSYSPDERLPLTVSAVYNKLITTSLKYTPVVLEHHCPCKILPNGKLCVPCAWSVSLSAHPRANSKGPTQTRKWKTLQKLILSFFHNAIHVLTQLSDRDTLVLALTETAKLVPYATSNHKSVKLYLKVRRRSPRRSAKWSNTKPRLVLTCGRVRKMTFALPRSSPFVEWLRPPTIR